MSAILWRRTSSAYFSRYPLLRRRPPALPPRGGAQLEGHRPPAAVQVMPVAAAAFFATRFSLDPVFRSALFADFLAFFDKDPDFLRFFMNSSHPRGSFSLAHSSVRWQRPYARQSFLSVCRSRLGGRSARSGRSGSPPTRPMGGQVPRLAGQGEENHCAHRGLATSPLTMVTPAARSRVP